MQYVPVVHRNAVFILSVDWGRETHMSSANSSEQETGQPISTQQQIDKGQVNHKVPEGPVKHFICVSFIIEKTLRSRCGH